MVVESVASDSFFSLVISNKFSRCEDEELGGAGAGEVDPALSFFFIVSDDSDNSGAFEGEDSLGIGGGLGTTGVDGVMPTGRLFGDGRGELRSFSCSWRNCESLSNSNFFLRCCSTNEEVDTLALDGFVTVRETFAADSSIMFRVNSRSRSFLSSAYMRI